MSTPRAPPSMHYTVSRYPPFFLPLYLVYLTPSFISIYKACASVITFRVCLKITPLRQVRYPSSELQASSSAVRFSPPPTACSVKTQRSKFKWWNLKYLRTSASASSFPSALISAPLMPNAFLSTPPRLTPISHFSKTRTSSARRWVLGHWSQSHVDTWSPARLEDASYPSQKPISHTSDEPGGMHSMQLFEVPDILERLRHNDIPSDVEIHAIRDSIAIAQSRIVALQSQPPTVETEVLAKYVAGYSSFLSPIRRLPVDILQTIFLDPIAHRRLRPGGFTRRSIIVDYRPNNLGAVCYHWRCLSMETKKLWSSLVVFPYQTDRYKLGGLRVALQRSLGAPLYLKFHPAMTGSILDRETIEEVLRHTERWAHVDLTTNAGLLRQLSPARHRLESLDTLTILYTDSHEYLEQYPSELFAEAPMLLPILPWSQITQLCIHVVWTGGPPSTGAYYYMLSQATNLREYDVYLPYATEPGPHPIISHHLKEMRVYGPSQWSMNDEKLDVLEHSVAPALEKLALVYCKFNISTLLSFLSRSSAQLQTLEIDGASVRAADFISFLRMVPTVKRLVLRKLLPNAVTDLVIQSLTIGVFPPDEVLLPMMTSFTLDGGYIFKADSLMSMLESRLTPPDEFSRLAAIDIILPLMVVSAARLQNFAIAAKQALEAFSFVCVDEARTAVAVAYRSSWL
ncbi:hypothetical protein R3P38DRAFT_3594056 [Favolaschia claudopus]|uniref:F-box domain-containing protein n=1 Tax=Favolaschia claudopus TaxID=2862362 RepID=A0AAW0DJF1_9AGAR